MLVSFQSSTHQRPHAQGLFPVDISVKILLCCGKSTFLKISSSTCLVYQDLPWCPSPHHLILYTLNAQFTEWSIHRIAALSMQRDVSLPVLLFPFLTCSVWVSSNKLSSKMAQDDVPGSSTGAPFISTGTNCPHMSVSFLVLVRVSQMASQSPRMLPGMRQTLICFSKQSLRLSYCLWGLWSCPASLTCAGDSLWTQLQLSKES